TVEHALIEAGMLAYVLDGDNIRHGLNKNLGFSAEDRAENIRRIGEVGKLFADAGFVALASFISPYRADRDRVRALMDDGDFFEIFVDTPLEVCEERDPKGLYKRAHAGEIPHFTGVSDPYEPPEKPELVIKAADCTPQEAALQVLRLLQEHGKFIRRPF
ncbi:MAG: adenylyl-sulfate kinase, partial [Candidatus Latescibacteria bacterium]|nr:adenylyl-sulfate kinase [Candidatus Latescibacterota bacterium]